MMLQYIMGAVLMACAFAGCIKKSEANAKSEGWVCPECQCGEDSQCGCTPDGGCKCKPGDGCQCKPGQNCTKSN